MPKQINVSGLRDFLLGVGLREDRVDQWLLSANADGRAKRASRILKELGEPSAENIREQARIVRLITDKAQAESVKIVKRAMSVGPPMDPAEQAARAIAATPPPELPVRRSAGTPIPSQPMPRGAAPSASMLGDVEQPDDIRQIFRSLGGGPTKRQPQPDVTNEALERFFGSSNRQPSRQDIEVRDAMRTLGGGSVKRQPQPDVTEAEMERFFGSGNRPPTAQDIEGLGAGEALPTVAEAATGAAPTAGAGGGSILSAFLGEKAGASSILADVEKGIKIKPDAKVVKQLLEELGIDLSKSNLPNGLRNIQRMIGRAAGDVGEIAGDTAKALKARVDYQSRIGFALKTVQDAAAGEEAAIAALSTGKMAGFAKDLLAKIRPSFTNLAVGAVGGMLADSAVHSSVAELTGEADAERKLAGQQAGVQSFDDLLSEYQMQRAAGRAASRMAIDFPGLMAAGGGNPQGPMPAPTDPRLNPGEAMFPGGGGPPTAPESPGEY